MIEPEVFVGRVDLLERAHAALVDRRSHGVVVHGAPGVGTTALVEQLERTLDPRVAVRHTRGSVGSGGVPYGAVMPLLRDGPGDALEHPLRALRAAVDHLVAEGAHSVVLVVHGARYVDPWSALVLSTLASVPDCSLVLVADSLTTLPRDVAVLLRDGALTPVEVPPLTPAETAALVEVRCGTPAPERLVERLWRASGGHVRSLLALLDHLDACGAGALLDLDRWPGRPAPALEAALPTAHAALSPADRRLLDVLALTGGLSLPHAARVGGGEAVETLLSGGLARVTAAPRPRVRVCTDVVAAAVRHGIGAGRRVQLLHATFPNGEPDDDDLVLPYARWAADGGVGLGLPTALRAARVALEGVDAGTALVVLDAVPEAERSPAHRVLTGLALLLAGRHSDGLSALLSMPRLAADDDAAAAEVAWGLGACPDLRLPQDGGRWGTAGRLLLDLAPTAWRTRLPAGRAAVAAVADLAAGGALPALEPLRAEVARLADRAAGAGSTDGAAWRGAVRWRLAEAVALTEGRTSPDLTADHAVPAGLDARTHGRLSVALVAYLLGHDVPPGELGEADPGDPGATTLLDLSAGLEALRAGALPEARAAFGAVLAVAPELDPAGARALAAAGAALAAAEDGDAGAAHAHLAVHAEEASSPGRWLPLRVAALLAAAAASTLGEPGAGARLVLEGRHDAAAGRHLMAVRFFLVGALAGDLEAAALLGASAARVDGPLAAIGRAVATGLRQDDAAPLLRAAVDAEERGRGEAARRLALLAGAAASRRGDKDAAREARVLQARVGVRTQRAAAAGVPRLTRREAEIAALVTRGLDNHEVAAALHLSVRTVEGHVSRIYAKLGVTSRPELAALLP